MQIENLSVQYTTEGGLINALVDINLAVRQGEIVALLGKTGSGKSTLLRSILGSLSPNAKIGRSSILIVNGCDMLHSHQKDLRSLRKSYVASMPQNPLLALNPTMTCGEQVSEVIDARKKERKEIALSLFERVRLAKADEIYRAYPHQISLGQLQRVSLAMALAAHPQLLLVDEPFSSLDSTNASLLSDLFRDLSVNQNITFIMITHDLKITESLANRWIWIDRGQILAERSGSIRQMNDLPVIITQVVASATLVDNHRAKFTSDTEPLVSLNDISYRYQKRKNLSLQSKESSETLSGINFSITHGQILGIVGQSGSGKSTLAKIIGGLITDFEGFLHHRFQEDGSYFKHVQYIMQDPATSIPPLRSVGKIILDAFKAHFPARTKKERAILLDKVLNDVGLTSDYQYKYRYQLSGGEKQRIILARALVVKPAILVLDETLSALDRDIQYEILQLLENLMTNYNLSIILVSHDLNLIENYCHSVIYLEDGKTKFKGTTDDPVYHKLKVSKNIPS